MILLVDLGNSRLKWALWDGAVLHAGAALDHAAPLAPQLAAVWRQLPPLGRVLVASVARADLEHTLAAAVVRYCGRAAEFVRSRATACGVTSAYAVPETLGVDRFLALIALHAAGAAPCVLASVGTALTLDAMAADGRHLGGLIAPSPSLMQQALAAATARARSAPDAALSEMAGDTAAAVHSGCWLAAVALVERFHGRAAAALGGAPSLILAGGDGARLAPLLALPARYEVDLVLRGLAVWAGA